MNWLNVRTETFRAPEYIGSDPVSRATWFNITAYCCEQENGGRIIGAATWKDRQWQQTCGVTLEEVRGASPLIVIDGNDVVVWRYPVEKEAEIQTKRVAGSRGGRKRAANQNPTALQAELEAQSKQNPSSPSTEWNGMEEEGNGRGKEEGTPQPSTASTIPGMPSKEQWLARIATPVNGCEWPEWWERKWFNLEATGWQKANGQEIKRWETHQDSLIPYFRSDFAEKKAKEVNQPKEVDIEALERANTAQRKKEQAEVLANVLNGNRE